MALDLAPRFLGERRGGAEGSLLLVSDDQLSCGVGRAGGIVVHDAIDGLAPGRRRERGQYHRPEQNCQNKAYLPSVNAYVPIRASPRSHHIARRESLIDST